MDYSDEWIPAAELFPKLKIGDWFEMEYAAFYRFEKIGRSNTRRWAFSGGSWSFAGFTSMTAADQMRAMDKEARIRQCERPKTG